MLIEIFLALTIGILFGTFTGLIPGIHINLIGIILISISASFLSFIQPIFLIVFIVAMAITHTFVDFIPSIFLGCPDTDTELSILPGHELLKAGKGYEAILLTCYGSLAAIFTLILIAFPATLVMGKINLLLTKQYILPSLLILVSIVLISTEKNKPVSLFVFLLAGFLGISVLNLDLKEPLLPLLTGLFGASTLILSIKTKTDIPPQEIKKPSEDISKPLAGAFLGSLIASPFSSFLPGLGSGQAAIIGNLISKTDRRGFLVLLGATNTLVMGFSFITLYTISRTRTGAAIAIQEIFGNISWQILILILLTILVSGLFAFNSTIFLAKFFSKKIPHLNYSKLSLATLSILALVVFFVSSFSGLVVLAVATLTGIYCINLGVRRTNMMGVLLLPTILFYLFL